MSLSLHCAHRYGSKGVYGMVADRLEAMEYQGW